MDLYLRPPSQSGVSNPTFPDPVIILSQHQSRTRPSSSLFSVKSPNSSRLSIPSPAGAPATLTADRSKQFSIHWIDESALARPAKRSLSGPSWMQWILCWVPITACRRMSCGVKCLRHGNVQARSTVSRIIDKLCQRSSLDSLKSPIGVKIAVLAENIA